MSKVRRVGVGVVGIGVLVLAILWWRGRANEATPPGGEGSAGSAIALRGSRQARDASGAPGWFGHPGVKGRAIAGIVVDDRGAPVAGASVRLASRYTMARGSGELARTTDANGAFDFGMQIATRYLVVAEVAGRTGDTQIVELRDPTAQPAPEQLVLVLYPCDAAIHGVVRDAAGGVVPGAVVSLAIRSEVTLTTSLGARADDQGKYELCVPMGGALVSVRVDGYAPVLETVNVSGRTRRDFTLVPGAAVVGKAVRADDKSPVEGAIVELRSNDRRNADVRATTSGADGSFHFDDVAPGRHVASAHADQLATSGPVDIVAEIGGSEEVVCELVTAHSIAGVVVEADGGKPAAGVTVGANGKDGYRNAVTQADGTFVIPRLTPSSYSLSVEGNRQQDQDIIVEAKDVTGLRFEVEPTGSIAGRVLMDGKPVHDAVIYSQERRSSVARTDREGRYTLLRVPAGEHTLYAQSDRLGAFARSQPVLLEQREQKTGVDVTLDLAGSVAGVLVDQHGAPVPGAFLSFSLLGGRDYGTATTADDGSFVVRALSGGGDYVFEVRVREDIAQVYPPVSGKRHAPVTVRDGATKVTGLRVMVRVDRLTIAGRVIDANGKPVPDAIVSASSDDRRGMRGPSATTDERGAFSIPDLGTGSYTIVATAGRGEARTTDVAAGRTDVVLQLQAPGAIEGTVAGFSKPPEVMAFRFDTSSRYRATLTDNTFAFRDLSVGEYWVMASNGQERRRVTVKVESGKTQQITLKLVETAVLEGSFVDAKRQPIANVTCVTMLADTTHEQRDMTRTDARGTFRFERAPVGPNMVSCYGTRTNAYEQVTVVAGQPTRVELVAEAAAPPRTRATAGMTLQDQLGEIRVATVAPDGPAAKAGVKVGDVVVKIGGEELHGAHYAQTMIEYAPLDQPLKLVVERDDKELALALALEAAK